MTLHHRRYGPTEGVPLILLHGLLGSADNWHALAERMKRDRAMWAVDLRNHGRSPHADGHSYPLMAGDVLRLMDQEGIEQADLLGHSMGGKVAMEIALEDGERVRNLIVEDMVPGPTTPQNRRYVEGLRNIDLNGVSTRKETELRLAASVPDRLMALFLLKNLHRNPDGTFSWRANLDALYRNYDEIWAGLSPGRRYYGNALFIAGSRSTVITAKRQSEIMSAFPKAVIRFVDGAGHWVHGDAPDLFASIVLGFLGR